MDINKYYPLAIFLGIICKIYDDLYDNNLYEYLNIQKQYIPYLNELLKCLFGIGFTVILINFSLVYLLFIVINTFSYFLKKDEYGPYELSGLISSIILIPFVNWTPKYNYTNFLFLMIGSVLALYIFDNKIINMCEYSYTKLIVRAFAAFNASILLFFINDNVLLNNVLFYINDYVLFFINDNVLLNNVLFYINDYVLFFINDTVLLNNIIIILLLSIAYLITSCMFQWMLLKKDEKTQQITKMDMVVDNNKADVVVDNNKADVVVDNNLKS